MLILTLNLAMSDGSVKSRHAIEELITRQSVESFAVFFRLYPPSKDYTYGRHTTAMLDALDKVTKQVESGESAYVCICIPPRHGKSDVASRRYPAWHLLRNRDHEVIIASYNYILASSMSYDCRAITQTVGASHGFGIKQDRSALGSWNVTGGKGAVHSAGIGGTITGRGAHILIVDDYYKNREEAESETIRRKKWESFQSDLLTRLAPVHAVVIVANRWHEDDVVGTIERKNDKLSKDYDEDFPEFEMLKFPAQDENTKEYLFTERFTEKWYKTMRSFMGLYAWQSQGLQEPKPRTGNMLRADLCKIIKAKDVPDGLIWYRGWDLASSEKERVKSDPDYTVGTYAAYDAENRAIYISDVKRGQLTATKRNKWMIAAAEDDGMEVRVVIEVVAGYKDTYDLIKDVLHGKAVVRKVTPQTDKVARASILEPIFEAGHVYLVESEWNREWISEFLSFPSGKHDDQVDSLVVALYKEITGKGRMGMSR